MQRAKIAFFVITAALTTSACAREPKQQGSANMPESKTTASAKIRTPVPHTKHWEEVDEEYFVFKEKHLRMLREMAVLWNSCESGAPRIEMHGPAYSYKTLGRIIGFEFTDRDILDFDRDDVDPRLRQFHREVDMAFSLFVALANLAPGSYTYKNPLPDLNLETTRWQVNSDSTPRMMDLPMTKEITFRFTEDHAKLLRNSRAEWSPYDDAPAINPKRPYVEKTFFEVDMLEILGIPMAHDLAGYPEPSKEQIEDMNKLHEEMLFALQTLLKFGQLTRGRYLRKPAGYGSWKKVSD